MGFVVISSVGSSKQDPGPVVITDINIFLHATPVLLDMVVVFGLLLFHGHQKLLNMHKCYTYTQ